MVEDMSAHWDRIYGATAPTEVSWFQADPAPSLSMIATAGTTRSAVVIDLGAGASTLVDQLLNIGFDRLTALDISDKALEVARARLKDRAGAIEWIVANATTWSPPKGAYDLWHDRAVFDFLVDDDDRQGYLRALNRGLRVGGRVILAPFALSGPDHCSGLPVRRYSPQTLRAALGRHFELLDAKSETHVTPGGASQDFTWCLFQKIL